MEIPYFLQIMSILPSKSAQKMTKMRSRLTEGGAKAIECAKLPSQASDANIFSKIIAETQKDDAALTDEDINGEARNLLIAGNETTATSLTYIVWAVIQRPEIQERLEAELSKLSDADIKDKVLEKLPFLNAVILETLRLYGPASSSLPREVPVDGADLAGHFIPEGTIVDTQAYTMHRLKSVWGKDVLSFKPDRWLENGASLQKQVGEAFSPFGAGSRTCIGIHLAWMELRLGLVTIFRECKGLKLASEMTEDEMVFEDFFSQKPRGRRCIVTFG